MRSAWTPDLTIALLANGHSLRLSVARKATLLASSATRLNCGPLRPYRTEAYPGEFRASSDIF